MRIIRFLLFFLHKKVTAPTTQPYPVARNTYGSVMDAFSPSAGAKGGIDDEVDCIIMHFYRMSSGKA